jgi:hypothetical protein
MAKFIEYEDIKNFDQKEIKYAFEKNKMIFEKTCDAFQKSFRKVEEESKRAHIEEIEKLTKKLAKAEKESRLGKYPLKKPKLDGPACEKCRRADEEMKSTMLKKEKLIRAGVTIPGFSNEVKKPLIGTVRTDKKDIFIIVEGIFPRKGALSSENDQDIRGGILGVVENIPTFPETMASYWADYYLDNCIPSEFKFSNFEECKEICQRKFSDLGKIYLNVLEDIIIIISGKPFQDLGWITNKKRSFIPLTNEEVEQCQKLSKSREFSLEWSKSILPSTSSSSSSSSSLSTPVNPILI